MGVVPLVTGWRPAADESLRPSGPPLVQLFAEIDRLVWSRPGVRPKSRANRLRTAELAATLPPHPTPADIMVWLAHLDALYEPGTVDNHRKGLSAVYTYGAMLNLSHGNPAAGAFIPRRRSSGKPHPIVNIAEVWPLLLAECADAREAAFLGALRFAGLRRGEALGLNRGDITQDPAGWRVNVVRQRPDPNDLEYTPPKSESGCRELPVRGPLRDLLAPVLALPDAVVRTGHGGGGRAVVSLLFPYRENDLKGLLARLRAVAPLAFPVAGQGRGGAKAWHALRDTLAVEMRQKGKTTSEVMEVLGHSSEYVTRTGYLGVYGRPVDASRLDGMDVAERGGAPPGTGPPREACAACGGSGTAGVRAPAVPRRSKAVTPATERQRCDTPSKTSGGRKTGSGTVPTGTGSAQPVQRALPRMAAAAVTMRPERAVTGTRAAEPRRKR